MKETVYFSSAAVDYHYATAFTDIEHRLQPDECILVTDENIAALYTSIFDRYRTIILPAGEQHKTFRTVEYITQQLIAHQAHRKTWLAGVGGGVVTDITGLAASLYMRGMPFALVPTTLLAMVDAAIGGKNGVDFGLHKNLLGTVRQPGFILFDDDFLKTLPGTEWSNGFAEVIKYACLFDTGLFDLLERKNTSWFQNDKQALNRLIKTCADWKNKIVTQDETETGMRKLLNFGHTAGHAIETVHHIPHGQAVAIGMLVACKVSEAVAGLHPDITNKLAAVLQQYALPVSIQPDIENVMKVLTMDKKRHAKGVDFIVLQDIGKPDIRSIAFDTVAGALKDFSDAGNH